MIADGTKTLQLTTQLQALLTESCRQVYLLWLSALCNYLYVSYCRSWILTEMKPTY